MRGLRKLAKVDKPSGRPWEQRVVMWLVGGAVGAALVVVGAYYFDEITESDEFCGTICHANAPQYITNQVSAHSEVECGTCHIGPGLLPKVEAKIRGVGELYKQVTNTYARPIELPVESLGSGSEICVQCHWPAETHEDQWLEFDRFAADEENAETRTILVTRLDRGEGPPELSEGSPWHMENVFYVAADPLAQELPWVGVERDGQMVEYWAEDSSLTAGELEGLPRRQMDCLDCHNRAAHSFRKPELVLDEALDAGLIDRNLPFVKREALRLLTASYPTDDAAVEAIEGLKEFYQSEYPDLLSTQQVTLDWTVDVVQDIYRYTTFPDMKLTWDTYADNSGHTDFPGCFRCHDGQHLNAQGDAIALSCGTCHSIPIVVRADQETDVSSLIDLIGKQEVPPESHESTSFIREHGSEVDGSCTSCHGRIDYGDDNASFCANEACHSREWPRAELSAAFSHPVQLEESHDGAPCSGCHTAAEPPSLDDCATCHEPPDGVHYGQDCGQCHEPVGWGEPAASWTLDVPVVPHGPEVGVECLRCHSVSGTHEAIPQAACVECHEAAGTVLAAPSVPHVLDDAADCVVCHSVAGTHETTPQTACLDCHDAGAVAAAPLIPHAFAGQEDCLRCHQQGGLEPAPLDHAERVNDSCLLCHEAG